MTQTYPGGSVTAPAPTPERGEEVQKLLAELILLSAAVTAVRAADLSRTEREKRLTPILARRVTVEALLFPAE